MAAIRFTFRPLEQWPKGWAATPSNQRRNALFRAPYSDTLEILEAELDYLGGRSIVLQAETTDHYIRLDGQLRSGARVDGPAIILSFDAAHGSLMYPCDTFTHWTDNLRAIALALRALRAVDRYGVTRQGEQYTGWLALPADVDAGMTREDAAGILVATAYGPSVERYEDIVEEVVDGSGEANGTIRRTTIRKALANAHPDAGGTDAHFHRVQKAREILVAT